MKFQEILIKSTQYGINLNLNFFFIRNDQAAITLWPKDQQSRIKYKNK